jgi:protein-tyrosine phosphatase
MVDRTVKLDGFANARDLGGLPLIDGGVTPSGVFIRSENPDLVTPEGWEHLRERGVRTVIDLRRDDERQRDVHPRPAWATVRTVDLHDDAFDQRHWDEGLVGTALHYLEFLGEPPISAALLAVAAAGPGGVLLHCVGGRDRTGLISAVLLVIAGVETDAVVEDYLETVRNAPALAALQGVPNWEPNVDRLLAARGTSTERSFRAFLAGLDVTALLAELPPERAAALRSWRGSLG